MTVLEAITELDNIKPNNYSQAQKIRWLSRLDGRITAEIINAHEEGDGAAFAGYDEVATGAVLLAPAPYDDLYLRWLEAQIDFANNEYAKYNNSAAAFNAAYAEFAGHYHRSHTPKGTRLQFF